MNRLNGENRPENFPKILKLFACAVIFVLIVVSSVISNPGQVNPNEQSVTNAKPTPEPEKFEITVGVPQERKLDSFSEKDRVHDYSINLKRGEFIRVSVDPDAASNDVWLIISIFDVHGKLVARSEHEKSPLRNVAAAVGEAGVYRVKVEIFGYAAAKYKITLVERRPSDPRDRAATAFRLRVIEANKLNTSGSQANESGTDQIPKLNRAVKLFKTAGDRKRQTAALLLLAAAYERANDRSNALKVYQQALTVSRATKDYAGIAEVLYSLAGFHLKRKDYEQSVRYYKQSVQASKRAGDRSRQARTNYDIGYVYLESPLKDVAQALKYFAPALETQRTLGNRREETKALIKIGEAHLRLKQSSSALESYEKALTIAREIRDKNLESDAQQGIAQIQAGKAN